MCLNDVATLLNQWSSIFPSTGTTHLISTNFIIMAVDSSRRLHAVRSTLPSWSQGTWPGVVPQTQLLARAVYVIDGPGDWLSPGFTSEYIPRCPWKWTVRSWLSAIAPFTPCAHLHICTSSTIPTVSPRVSPAWPLSDIISHPDRFPRYPLLSIRVATRHHPRGIGLSMRVNTY